MTILDAAAQAILDRDHTHGDYENNNELTANFWNEYLASRPFSELQPHDVCMLNILQKISRVRCGTPDRDHFVDIAGWAELANRFIEIARKGEDDGNERPDD
jgi:hypothetical protein